MATKNANDAAKKKAAKEKKMLVVLIVLLVLALGYAYKTLTKLHGSSAPTPVTASSTTSGTAASTTPAASSTPSTSPSSTPAPSAPADVPAASASTGSASSASGGWISAVTPPLDQGQLRSFTLFDTKDPFDSQGPKAGSSTTSSSGGAPSSGTTTSPPAPTKSSSGSSPTAKPAAAPTSAVISVNGVASDVTVSTVFPITSDQASNGIFELVSLTATAAKIAVVGGSYASGAATLTLKVGQPVTLANTADGKRYTLELFPQGTPVPAAPATSGTAPSTNTTTTPGS